MTKWLANFSAYFAQILPRVIISLVEINVLVDEGQEACLEVGWLQSVAEQVLGSGC